MVETIAAGLLADIRGEEAKRHYRLVDFKRDKENIPARVASIEYDPNRSAYIALLNYADGEKALYYCASWIKSRKRCQNQRSSSFPCRLLHETEAYADRICPCTTSKCIQGEELSWCALQGFLRS